MSYTSLDRVQPRPPPGMAAAGEGGAARGNPAGTARAGMEEKSFQTPKP